MTIYDDAWVKAEEAKRAWMDANGLYKAEDEHSSCGVGLVVADLGQAQPQGGGKRHQRAEGGLAPGRCGCRWQDRRRRGHSCADPGAVLLRSGAPHRA